MKYYLFDPNTERFYVTDSYTISSAAWAASFDSLEAAESARAMSAEPYRYVVIDGDCVIELINEKNAWRNNV